MQKSKRISKWFELTDIIVYMIQLLFSILLVFLIEKVLPIKYWILAAGVLAFIWLTFVIVSIVLTRKKYNEDEKNKKRKLQNKKLSIQIISIFISMILAIGSALANEGLSTIKNISNATYQTQLYLLLSEMTVITKELPG